MSLLKVEHLSKSFKGLQVLRDVSLEVREGERHVIIGPNGAGKTTLFNCMTGTLPINEGKVVVNGQQISGLPAYTAVRMGMSRTFQKNNLFGELSVEENIHLAVTACKPYRFHFLKPASKYAEMLAETQELLAQWGLWERRSRIVSELSYGEQRLLEVILALASKPNILLLDEPTSGMSPAETVQTTMLIQSMPRSITLLVIEHDMEVVFSIADRITVLHHGEVFLSGSPDEISGDARVKEIYFGGGTLKHA
ncbi:ABC transporter ATP-binding protein [Brevibacillus centrosporus]|uniref:Amino acid/amide ABC transporter ATP-binding protein 1, HAAT family n=1 Tax=Brevibacillus centrosporus TaxID=54910 RepID=A0A1I3XCC5_9BACL|nr:ABC transporter ATP-binding protein [Brevibacillus centrosporus]MEC2133185.1 ABC transporter ATP-binding protein [Brevibacillus centrosporus]MED4910939.1 ABC transporter ATP-binding protein [Brevibacillus centrosporus]RNB64929.1 ABC transporter ATP-binding protein [Brevibacillus centrosporus]SFK17215.1 amino acid/amide ABC transporter ATP-binding protein 1, HAAT family [Brevibacillus centrosporus]GED31210.1 ABC transporter ATP-binding protein [Brevibacillus centrosporus]